MGPDVYLRGFFHGCGFNSSGIMLAGGCGNELAKWIIHGQPDLDMWSYNIRYLYRFWFIVSRNNKTTKQTKIDIDGILNGVGSRYNNVKVASP